MQCNDSNQNKKCIFQAKINQLESVVQQLKAHVDNSTKLSTDINQLLSSLKTLQNRLSNDELNMNFFEKAIAMQKQSLELLLKSIQQRVIDNAVIITTASKKMESMDNEITQLKVRLAQNDGQTNQCYIGLDKLQKKFQLLHPFNINQQPTSPQMIQSNIKKMFSRIFVGIVVFITTGFVAYIGIKYWTKFIDDQYIKIHQTQTKNINSNTSQEK